MLEGDESINEIPKIDCIHVAVCESVHQVEKEDEESEHHKEEDSIMLSDHAHKAHFFVLEVAVVVFNSADEQVILEHEEHWQHSQQSSHGELIYEVHREELRKNHPVSYEKEEGVEERQGANELI